MASDISRALVGLFLLASSSGGSTQTVNEPQPRETINLSGDMTPLTGILRIATMKRLPLGILFGVNPTLCSTKRNVNLVDVSIEDALTSMLESTGYSLHKTGGAYNIIASDLNRREQEIVAYRFDRFGSEPDTMKGISTQLNGYIVDVIEGRGGFFGSSLSNSEEERVRLPLMTEATIPEIADTVVLNGSHGLWTLRPRKKQQQRDEADSAYVGILSYHDDAHFIQNLTCDM